jgi:hypothetical protein
MRWRATKPMVEWLLSTVQVPALRAARAGIVADMGLMLL